MCGGGVTGSGLSPKNAKMLSSLLPNFLLYFFYSFSHPRWGLDRKGRLAIESYIRGNNLALDVSSVLDGYADKITL